MIRRYTTAASPTNERSPPEAIGVEAAVTDEAPPDEKQLPLGSIIKVSHFDAWYRCRALLSGVLYLYCTKLRSSVADEAFA